MLESFRAPKVAGSMHAPRGEKTPYEQTGPATGGYLCEVGRMALRAR